MAPRSSASTARASKYPLPGEDKPVRQVSLPCSSYFRTKADRLIGVELNPTATTPPSDVAAIPLTCRTYSYTPPRSTRVHIDSPEAEIRVMKFTSQSFVR